MVIGSCNNINKYVTTASKLEIISDSSTCPRCMIYEFINQRFINKSTINSYYTSKLHSAQCKFPEGNYFIPVIKCNTLLQYSETNLLHFTLKKIFINILFLKYFKILNKDCYYYFYYEVLNFTPTHNNMVIYGNCRWRAEC